MEDLAIMIVIYGSIAMYFLPSIIAFASGKRNSLAICALNVLTGWTILGWVISLIWSLIRDRK